jgi:hypothetical protein
MALSAFADKLQMPTPPEIENALGRSAALWAQLIDSVIRSSGGVTQTWSFSSAKYGWSLRLKKKERIILYMTPQRGQFLVGVVLGERASAGSGQDRISPSARTLIDEAPRYAEGRGIRFSVRTRHDLQVALELAALKSGS